MGNIQITERDNFVPQAKILRVMTLLVNLYQKSFTAEQAADILGTSPRTAYRYLHLLESIGVEVDSNGKSYFIAQDDCPICHGHIKDKDGNFLHPSIHHSDH